MLILIPHAPSNSHVSMHIFCNLEAGDDELSAAPDDQ